MSEKAELDTLFVFVMQYARAWMAQHPALVPFAAAMTRDRHCELMFASTDRDDSRPLREILAEGLRSRTSAESCLAVALCIDVRLTLAGTGLTDSLFVYLEHECGLALQVITPYSRQDGTPVYRETRASRGVPHTFFDKSVH